MKVSVVRKPNDELTLTGSVQAVAAAWTTVLTVPAGIHGKVRHFQLSNYYNGACGIRALRILRGATTIWMIYAYLSNNASLDKLQHYDCNQVVEPGDLIQANVWGTPSFSLDLSCVATLFPTQDRKSDESAPLPGRLSGQYQDAGMPPTVLRAGVASLLEYLRHDPPPYGRGPWKPIG